MSSLVVFHSVPSWLPVTEPWLYHLVRSLPVDIVSHIVCLKEENLDQFAIPHLHTYPNTTWLRHLTSARLLRWGFRRRPAYTAHLLHTHGARLLHSHFGHLGWQRLDAVAKTGVRHLVSFYGVDISAIPKQPLWRKRYQELFDAVDAVLSMGSNMSFRLRALGCPAEKIHLHRMGVALGQIPFQPRSWNPERPLRVLMASTFREKKGIPYGLRALGQLCKELPVEITLIGDATSDPADQEEKARILATLREEGLEDRVRRLGFQPHHVFLAEAMRHDVFLSPSTTAANGDMEGIPISIVEMLSSGIPVVSTRHADIPEVVIHDRTGLLAEERDVDGLVTQLRRLVENPALGRQLAEAARRHIEEEYDVATQSAKLAAIYHRILA